MGDIFTLSVLFLQPVGVKFGLLATHLGINHRLLCFDDRQRFAIVAIKRVIGEAFAGLIRLMRHAHFLSDLLGRTSATADVPSGGDQSAVNHAAARGRFVEAEHIGGGLCLLRDRLQLGGAFLRDLCAVWRAASSSAKSCRICASCAASRARISLRSLLICSCSFPPSVAFEADGSTYCGSAAESAFRKAS